MPKGDYEFSPQRPRIKLSCFSTFYVEFGLTRTRIKILKGKKVMAVSIIAVLSMFIGIIWLEM